MPGARIGRSTRGALACLLAVALLAAGTAATSGAIGGAARAAADEPPDDPLTAELVTAGQGGTRIDTEPTTGAVSFVGFPAGTAWRPGPPADPAAAAERFVARFGPLFGVRAEQLRAATREPRPQGGWTVRFAQGTAPSRCSARSW